MYKARRVKLKIINNRCYVDMVPVDVKQRINDIEYLGLGEQHIYKYKNGNEDLRWRLVECSNPDKEAWFILNVDLKVFVFSQYQIMAVSMDDKYLKFYWLTRGTMRISSDGSCLKTLSKMEAANVEFSIMSALAGVDNK